MQALGVGLYTLSDAAHLIHAERRAVRRWLCGYDFKVKVNDQAVRRHSDPLWRTQYAGADLGDAVIGFQDLLELRVVREFVSRGVPLLVVRHCMQAARELFGGDYPLTRHRFVTDGATIYHEALKQGQAEGAVLNLRTRQYAFREIIRESLYSGIEYDGAHARRWFPEPRSKSVVLDPELQFGRPTLTDSGVPTASIYATFLAEGRQRSQVARLFEIEPRAVDAAVRFEERMRLAA